MKQSTSIYLVLIFTVVLSAQIDAKRGCALYGHSCYGGHGKRSPDLVEVFPRDDIPSYRQMLDDARREPMHLPDEVKDIEMHPRYRLMNIIRQWVEENRASQKFNDMSNLSNELFKESPPNTI